MPRRPLPEETWAPFPLDSRYDISDAGRARSWAIRSYGEGGPRAAEPTLLNVDYKQAYPRSALGGRCGWVRLHVAVLLTFRGPPPDKGYDGSHIDGNRSNNRLSNLLWETRKENVARMVVHGTKPTGDRHGTRTKPESVQRGDRHWTKRLPEKVCRGEACKQTKLTAEMIDEAAVLRAAGWKYAPLAARYGVSVSAVRGALLRNGRSKLL